MTTAVRNRWAIAFAGVVMQVALGAVYAWSVSEFRSRKRWDGRFRRSPSLLRLPSLCSASPRLPAVSGCGARDRAKSPSPPACSTAPASFSGHQVVKFSPDGKVLMRLGRAGIAGDGTDTFNQPSDVAVASNGDIFVADGHGGKSNARIVKFSPDGKFIKTWGRSGSARGEFDEPHGIDFDSRGRLFVADRNNNRIQIFDQDGNFLDEWRQFGRPSGLSIGRNDVLYVSDSESDEKQNPGWIRAIRIGSAKDGAVTAMIPITDAQNPAYPGGTGAEDVAVDEQENLYGAEVNWRTMKKYVRTTGASGR